MIYLYLKTHNKTGLKYLGKTTKDPYKYKGSGKYWLRHLKKHGDDVTTEILFETECKKQFKKVALKYSNKYNIVESMEFANMRPESGDGGDNSAFVNYDSVSNKLKGRKKSPQEIENNIASRRNGAGWGQRRGIKWDEKHRENALKGMYRKGFDYNKNPNKISKGIETRRKNGNYVDTNETKKLKSIGMKKVWEKRKNSNDNSIQEKHKKRVQDGTHNLVGTVTCRDIFGNVVQVPQSIFHSQKEITTNKKEWKFVSVRSKEGIRRKTINNSIIPKDEQAEYREWWYEKHGSKKIDEVTVKLDDKDETE